MTLECERKSRPLGLHVGLRISVTLGKFRFRVRRAERAFTSVQTFYRFREKAVNTRLNFRHEHALDAALTMQLVTPLLSFS